MERRFVLIQGGLTFDTSILYTVGTSVYVRHNNEAPVLIATFPKRITLGYSAIAPVGPNTVFEEQTAQTMFSGSELDDEHLAFHPFSGEQILTKKSVEFYVSPIGLPSFRSDLNLVIIGQSYFGGLITSSGYEVNRSGFTAITYVSDDGAILASPTGNFLEWNVNIASISNSMGYRARKTADGTFFIIGNGIAIGPGASASGASKGTVQAGSADSFATYNFPDPVPTELTTLLNISTAYGVASASTSGRNDDNAGTECVVSGFPYTSLIGQDQTFTVRADGVKSGEGQIQLDALPSDTNRILAILVTAS